MHHKLKVLDLFSGIGGFSLGLERAGMETVAFCEIEDYPRKVLKKHWPDVPIYEDIRELTSERLEADGITADLICGGYPCQPFSTAGKRQGEGDDRHLWPEMYRLIKTLRPRWVIAENVAGHISMGLDAVLSDLEAEDYAWWPFVIPACAVDAKHRRDRIWILAADSKRMRSPEQECEYQWTKESDGSIEDRLDAGNGMERGNVANAKSEQNRRIQQPRFQADIGASNQGKNVANTKDMQRNGGNSKSECRISEFGNHSGERGKHEFWPTEPPVGRVANGIPRRVERLRGLGNAVVPQIPEIIGRAIMEIERSYEQSSERLRQRAEVAPS